jgi:hypothetical protein
MAVQLAKAVTGAWTFVIAFADNKYHMLLD